MDSDERDRLATIEALQAERHIENNKKIDKIDGTTTSIFRALSKLQCQTHGEKMKGMLTSITLLWTLMITVVIGGIVLGMWMK